jgi:branched-subunit amino acid aminotransferase/4-amino-4-deoxychorismate lyase
VNVFALAVSGRGLVPPGEPVIHVNDEAFMRGRGAFESLRVYGGEPFRLAEHLDRLDASCARLAVELPPRNTVEELVQLVLDAADETEAVLRVYATPGHGDGPVALAVVAELPPDLEALRATGIRAITVEFRPADLIGGVKSTSYALNMMAVDEARARGAEDAVFVAGDGTVLEATTSNVWSRRGRTLFTPAVDGRILAGVTRDVLLELGSAAGYEVVEGAFTVSELAAADEAFASSSIREVMPIVALDGRPIGMGKPGEAAAELQAALRELACR